MKPLKQWVDTHILFPSMQGQPVSHFPCHILAYTTHSRSLLSSHPQNGKQTNQDGLNPKRRKKIASSNSFQHIVMLECIYIYCIYFITLNISCRALVTYCITLRLKITRMKFSLPATPTSTLDQWKNEERELRDILQYFLIE